MRLPVSVSRAIILASLAIPTALLAACGQQSTGDPGTEPGVAGVKQALGRVHDGFSAGDGPLVCSFLQRGPQVAFAARQHATACIDAVSEASRNMADAERRSLGRLENSTVSITAGTASVDGPAATALTRVLGVSKISLTRVQGVWMLQ